MKAKSALPLLFALVLLSSCSWLRDEYRLDSAAQPHCGSGVCRVEVAVNSCERGDLTVNPDPITVPSTNNIIWTITTPGFKFMSSGIVIEGLGFRDQPGVTGNGRVYIVHDAWTDRRRDIKYTILLSRDSDGRPCRPFDPRISNL